MYIKNDTNPLKTLKEYQPIIEKQNLDKDIYILGEKPIFRENNEIIVDKGLDISLENRDSKGIYFQKINKSRVTARKFKNKIFLGTDGNYYISKKNTKGDYVWVLVEKR